MIAWRWRRFPPRLAFRGRVGFNRQSARGKLAALFASCIRRYPVGMLTDSTQATTATTWFISRHSGAIEWAKCQGLAIGRWAAHLDPAEVKTGDTVIGTLPVNLAAEICKRGALYLHLSLALPAHWRGRELSAQELLASRAKLKAFHIGEAP